MQAPIPRPVICSFPNIRPINSVAKGIRQGHYNHHYPYINAKTVPLRRPREEKTIHLVCFGEIIGPAWFQKFLRAEGKRPCENAPNYLLGLMAQVPEHKMPEALCDFDIVTAGPMGSSSVFTGRPDYHFFLCVRRTNGTRALSELSVNGLYDGRIAFLAEDLVL